MTENSKPILIGAGSLCRDLIDIFGPDAFAGIYVDPAFETAPIRGVPVFTSWDSVLNITSHYVLSISDIEHRKRAITTAHQVGLQPAPPMVSRTAIVAADAVLTAGAVICHMAIIGPSARLAENTLVMHTTIVAHDSVIGTNAVLCAGVCLGGYVEIGSHTFVGPNAVLAPKLKMGESSHIGAGAACFKNGDPGSRWIGNPARRAFAG